MRSLQSSLTDLYSAAPEQFPPSIKDAHPTASDEGSCPSLALRAAAFDAFATPACVIDADGDFVACNAAAGALFGAAPSTLLGQPWWLFACNLDNSPDPAGWRQLQVRSGGRLRPMRVRELPLGFNGDSMVALLVFEEHAVLQECSLEPGRDSLLLDAAHEIRSLMQAVILGLDGFQRRRGASAPQEHRLLDVLQHSSMHLQTLVENLLGAASMDAHQFGALLQPADLADAIREAINVVEPLLAPAELRIRFEPPVEPLHALADRQRLRQVLTNLLQNAIKFSPAGGTIVVRACLQAQVCRIEVHDDGPGVPPDEHQRIFERFYRSRTAGAVAGTGLGLAVCKAIVEAHHGAIGVQSRPGGGSTFWFTVARE